MESHEDNGTKRRRPRRARLATAVMALVGALALAAPGVASAAKSVTITQNTSMIVNVSGPSSTAVDVVSWGDVSWGDVSWADSTLVG